MIRTHGGKIVRAPRILQYGKIKPLSSKEVEQVTIDLWLEGKVAPFNFTTDLYMFQKKRGLMKTFVYSHDGCIRCPRCGIAYPNAMGLEHEKVICNEILGIPA